MKNLITKGRGILLGALLVASAGSLYAADPVTSEQRIGVVNFRKTIEESKLGKQQQQAFEALQNQMESSLMEQQKSLSDITTKLGDEDYLDGLTPEAENELKHKYRALSQELARTQNQFVQTLQEANMKIIQQIAAEVAEASKEVGKVQQFDAIINDEAVPYHKPGLDVTKQIIAQMDIKFDKEQKQQPNAANNASKGKPETQKKNETTTGSNSKNKNESASGNAKTKNDTGNKNK